MNLFCLKYITNRQKRNTFYSKCEKLGITHCMPISLKYDYHIITPQLKIVGVSFEKLDVFMFGGEHVVYEARNEKEFFELIKTKIMN